MEFPVQSEFSGHNHCRPIISITQKWRNYFLSTNRRGYACEAVDEGPSWSVLEFLRQMNCLQTQSGFNRNCAGYYCLQLFLSCYLCHITKMLLSTSRCYSFCKMDNDCRSRTAAPINYIKQCFFVGLLSVRTDHLLSNLNPSYFKPCKRRFFNDYASFSLFNI